jgi:hypothetical protein
LGADVKPLRWVKRPSRLDGRVPASLCKAVIPEGFRISGALAGGGDDALCLDLAHYIMSCAFQPVYELLKIVVFFRADRWIQSLKSAATCLRLGIVVACRKQE